MSDLVVCITEFSHQHLQEAIEAAIIIEFESKDIILSIYNNANLIYSDKPYNTICQTCHQRYENG